MNTTTHESSLFVIDRDSDGASIDHLVKIPLTVTASTDEEGTAYQSVISYENIDNLIEQLMTIRSTR